MNAFIRIAAVLISVLSITSAANYYIDPATGAIGNDGSQGSPWNTLEAVAGAKTFAAGDTVICKGGYHGRVSLTGTYAQPVVFRNAAGENPRIRNLNIANASRIEVDGFTISPECETPYTTVQWLLAIGGTATNVTVENCSLYSKRDNTGWTKDNWNFQSGSSLVCSGVELRGHNCTLRNNYITNIRFGITVYTGDGNLLEYNTINHFSEDGIRAIGDRTVVQYNVVKNAYTVNAYHTDALQSWPLVQDGSDSRRNVIVRGNRFIHWEGERGPWNEYMQGVGCHDGMFEGWLIENNLVVTDCWVGMQLLGAVNCTLVNNTVVTIPGGEQPPWIKIGNHKRGYASTGCIIRNNLTMDIVAEGTGVTVDHNIGSQMTRLLVNDFENRDYTLKPGFTYAIDAGSAEAAPLTDINGTARSGAGVDLGCFEYDQGASMPDAGYRPKAYGISGLAMGPLPVTTGTELTFTADRGAAVTLHVHTPNGRSAAVRTFDAAPGTNRHALNLGSLDAGMYLYRITSGDGEVSRGKLIVE